MIKKTVKQLKPINFIYAKILGILLIVSYGVNADECVSQPSNNKATEVACLKLKSNLTELPAEAIQKLKIDAGFGWGIFNGSIYNGNDNYYIIQLVVSMIPIHNHHHSDMHVAMSHDPKVHQIDLELPPVAKGALSMPLASEDVHIHDFKWEIIKVMGYRID
ncbi:hypothetical protein [Nitrosomonas sp. Nm166]|uniref:hypothetical protein n=1 Tax=Nitrosomonas sp. Nm166 TaxID=1881054 RepID=UPI0008E425D0|nr:hypothetical protein [Nitrosomonas sp. Nm166]SFF24186.1 hypothetical protein SAMN05428977_10822 [Nitrosomonas sp. Nm166]